MQQGQDFGKKLAARTRRTKRNVQAMNICELLCKFAEKCLVSKAKENIGGEFMGT